MTIDVIVAYAAPGVQILVPVRLPGGATLADAVTRSAIIESLQIDAAALRFAIFGQRATPGTLLADGDRIELTRPLRADAKAARRARANATPRDAKSRFAKPIP
jgi:uncharacterized protein